jgi:hypothetical protein
MKKVVIISVMAIAIIASALYFSHNSKMKAEKKRVENKYEQIISNEEKTIGEYLNPTEKWSNEKLRDIETKAVGMAIEQMGERMNYFEYNYSPLIQIFRKRFKNNAESLVNFIYSATDETCFKAAKFLNQEEIANLKKIVLGNIKTLKSSNKELDRTTFYLAQLEPDTLMSLVRSGYYNQVYLEGFLKWGGIREYLTPNYWREVSGYVKDSMIIHGINTLWRQNHPYFWNLPNDRINRVLRKLTVGQLCGLQGRSDSCDKIIKRLVIQKLNNKGTAVDILTAWWNKLITEKTLVTYYRSYPIDTLIKFYRQEFGKDYNYLMIDNVRTREDYVSVAQFFSDKDLQGYRELLRKEKGCEK